MTRNQRILGVVLLVQVLAIVLLRLPSSGSEPAGPAPLVPALAENAPARIVLGDDAVTLTRGADGWSVADLDGFPADEKKIDALLDKIAAAQVRRPVVRSARYHESFEVTSAAPAARLQLFDDGDAPLADLLFGNTPNYGSIHVRHAGEDEVYEVAGLASYDVIGPAGNWIDKSWVGLSPDAITGLALTNVSGSFRLTRDGADWSVQQPAEYAGRSLGADQLDGLLSDLAGLTLIEPAGPRDPAQGYAEVGVRIELRYTGDDGAAATRVVEIGRPLDSDATRRYVARDDRSFAGVVWESSLSTVLEADVRVMMGEPAG